MREPIPSARRCCGREICCLHMSILQGPCEQQCEDRENQPSGCLWVQIFGTGRRCRKEKFCLPVPILQWTCEQQREDRANRPSICVQQSTWELQGRVWVVLASFEGWQTAALNLFTATASGTCWNCTGSAAACCVLERSRNRDCCGMSGSWEVHRNCCGLSGSWAVNRGPGWLVESAKHWERKKVPHLRWSQAPPLPWLRQGSADIDVSIQTETCWKSFTLRYFRFAPVNCPVCCFR